MFVLQSGHKTYINPTVATYSLQSLQVICNFPKFYFIFENLERFDFFNFLRNQTPNDRSKIIDRVFSFIQVYMSFLKLKLDRKE